jgi:hypothetical protein
MQQRKGEPGNQDPEVGTPVDILADILPALLLQPIEIHRLIRPGEEMPISNNRAVIRVVTAVAMAQINLPVVQQITSQH